MANGIIVIDKPAGWTSHDVVAKARGILRERRVGHGGTLDPMATGVLPIFVGRATRAVEFAAEAGKEYVAGLLLGVDTDTQDTTGTVLERRRVTAGRAEVEAVLARFRGELEQIPPMFSAIKKDGKKLYELARKGQEVEREPRRVSIHALELIGAGDCPGPELGFQPGPDVYFLRVACSKGTYVRTLCHDIGAALGCGGCMCALRRTQAAGFTLDDAVRLEDLQAAGDRAAELLLPVDAYFRTYPALAVDCGARERIRNGNALPWKAEEGTYRVYGPGGDFLMLGRVRRGVLETVKSFFEV